ncbi:MAG TPA: hypothetical protein V6D03_16420 [Candidatus Caenarcaniphilales bacterium]
MPIPQVPPLLLTLLPRAGFLPLQRLSSLCSEGVTFRYDHLVPRQKVLHLDSPPTLVTLRSSSNKSLQKPGMEPASRASAGGALPKLQLQGHHRR